MSVVHHPVSFDAELDAKVDQDLRTFRCRRAVFALISLIIIFSELALALAMLLTSLRDDVEAMIVYSSAATFIVTIDVTLGIRERAASLHATINQLRGIRAQMRRPESSLLWQEYALILGSRKINYVDALTDVCEVHVLGAVTEVDAQPPQA